MNVLGPEGQRLINEAFTRLVWVSVQYQLSVRRRWVWWKRRGRLWETERQQVRLVSKGWGVANDTALTFGYHGPRGDVHHAYARIWGSPTGDDLLAWVPLSALPPADSSAFILFHPGGLTLTVD